MLAFCSHVGGRLFHLHTLVYLPDLTDVPVLRARPEPLSVD